MVLFNYSTKEITAKIVYYGPGLCGKTTNLQFIYDSLPQTINKGKMLSLATKTDRTLFFDFLPIDLGTIRGMRTRLQLYTVPGQVFYNTTRKLVLKGADGVVFVADSQKRMIEANLESFGNLEENLAEHDMKLSDIPMILQFNKRDLPDVASIEELNARINKYNAPIYEAVAPTGIGVHETLKAITRLVLNSLKERYADKREHKTDPQAKASAVMAATSNRPSPVESREARPAPPAVREPAAASPAQHSTPHPTIKSVFDAPAAASVSSAPPESAAPEPAPALHDDGPLDLEYPELEEMAGDEEAISAGESIEAIDPMAPGSELEPELASADSMPGELMTAVPTGLTVEDDLLELSPETELSIETGGEELLELADEPLAELARLEDSIAMPLLDVTSEMAFDDEPADTATIEPELTAIPVTADGPLPEDVDSLSLDDSAAVESMLRQDTPDLSESLGDDPIDESFFEPVEAGTVVAEDHHDASLPVAEMASLSSTPPIPLALEPVEQPNEEGSHISPSSVTPRIPVSDHASRPVPAAADISCEPGVSREINLPVKLEIGGRSISFELKISLDLTRIAAYAGATSSDEGEARS